MQENLRSVGMAIIETGMAWFWSDSRIKKWSKVEGLHYLEENQKDGIVLVGVHFLTLELGARIIGLHHPGIGVYRPNDNPLLDWLQHKVVYALIKICLIVRFTRNDQSFTPRRNHLVWHLITITAEKMPFLHHFLRCPMLAQPLVVIIY
ncbi:lauryl-acyl carrier protein (ACP)-dependent acyltransferase [Haemophilus influenzae]|uniref:Lauryl-acyl carrier protein (ACP)-dependent acyltransferase n=1 Tax=Haemophilus influenzae TaxID=727 RepID=A0A2X1PKM4_HAEIF|nr:lauryl-acyl carrier protein (ACP)-dependent acyltransferase [Haemophilus influenzae]